MKVTVDLGERAYDVVVAEGARNELARLVRQRAPGARRCVLVASPVVASQRWFALDSGCEQDVLTVPDGEGAKTLPSLAALLEAMAARSLSREDVVVAVGGGAVTDLAGFAAAVYLRGVPVVHVPTSLVGQVDAAIGGKAGVNLTAGKNLAGAFHQPLGVLCDTEVLATLPERERRSGLGEVAKCWLLEGRGSAGVAGASLAELIELSVALKARVVAADEREGGARALLNYGHTLAHALEKIALARDLDELRHGEAVAIGLSYAVRLAEAMGRVDASAVAEHDAVLDALGLAHRLSSDYDVEAIVEAMGHDKKARHDLSFVLDGPEGFTLVRGVDPALVRRTLAEFQEE